MSRPDTQSADSRTTRYFWYALLLFVAGWLLYKVRGSFPLFLLGFFIAYAYEPLVKRLEGAGWRRRNAVRVVFAVSLLVGLLLVVTVVPFIAGQIEDLHRVYQESYRTTIAGWMADWETNLEAMLPRVFKPLVFEKRPPVITAPGADLEAQPRLRPAIIQRLESLRDRVVPRMLQSIAGWFQRSISGIVLLIFLLPIIVFYFMNDFEGLRHRVTFLVPPEHRARVVAVGRDINRTLARYFRGQFLIAAAFSLVAMVILGLWGLLFHMRFTFVLGLFSGILNIIPFLGMTLNVLLGAGIGYFTGSNPVLTAVLAGSTFIVINFVFDNFVTPRIMGRELGLHPLVVMFALLAGGEFGGILGMVVAVPVAGAIRTILAHLVPRLQGPVSDDVRELLPAVPRSVKARPAASKPDKAKPKK